MRIYILTLFPEMFTGPFDASIIKRAREKGLVEIEIINLRDFSRNRHRTVDDAPYGGGAGMVLAAEPVFEAVDWLKRQNVRTDNVFLLSPAGQPFNQALARELSRKQELVFICGHYEGVDERVCAHLVTSEISIGDYVLTGGELPAMVVVDAVCRLLPGVLGKDVSAREESFSEPLLEYPQYTRPRQYRGYAVPEVLLSGHHEQIRAWRRRQQLLRTLVSRPDLFKQVTLTPEDRLILQEIYRELKQLDLE